MQRRSQLEKRNAVTMARAQTMKAIVVNEFGPPTVLRYEGRARVPPLNLRVRIGRFE